MSISNQFNALSLELSDEVNETLIGSSSLDDGIKGGGLSEFTDGISQSCGFIGNGWSLRGEVWPACENTQPKPGPALNGKPWRRLLRGNVGSAALLDGM